VRRVGELAALAIDQLVEGCDGVVDVGEDVVEVDEAGVRKKRKKKSASGTRGPK
jgi:hypothetical protein